MPCAVQVPGHLFHLHFHFLLLSLQFGLRLALASVSISKLPSLPFLSPAYLSIPSQPVPQIPNNLDLCSANPPFQLFGPIHSFSQSPTSLTPNAFSCPSHTAILHSSDGTPFWLSPTNPGPTHLFHQQTGCFSWISRYIHRSACTNSQPLHADTVDRGCGGTQTRFESTFPSATHKRTHTHTNDLSYPLKSPSGAAPTFSGHRASLPGEFALNLPATTLRLRGPCTY